MLPTLARLSKASRRPLTSKRGNKDFYKGTRQSALPGGPFTGPPGKHVVRGKAKYRIVDEKVRVFVAPPIEAIKNSPLKPYVSRKVYLDDYALCRSKHEDPERPQFWHMGFGPGGLTADRYLNVLRNYQEYTKPYPERKRDLRRAQRARQKGRKMQLRLREEAAKQQQENASLDAVTEQMSTLTV